jgi:hypothetical protein
VSKATEQRRHEALARETASWRSWAVQQWWTNGNMAVELDEPFTGPAMELEYECSCDDNARRDHLHSIERLCVFRDVYRTDPKITRKLTAFLERAQAERFGDPLTIEPDAIPVPDEAGLFYYRARIGVDTAARAWVALNARYVDAIRKHGRPDQWTLCGLPRAAVGTEFPVGKMPFVVAARNQRGVGIVMPMTNNDSAIGQRIETPDYIGATS